MAGELREPLHSRFKILSLTSSKNWAPSPDDSKLYGVHMPLAIETTDPNTVTKACTNPYCFFSAAYHSRVSNLFFDDTNNKDEWQTAVYAYTRALVDEIGAISVADVGCGSGFKLVSFFGDMLTVGYDLEPTLSYLRKAYPGHAWLESNLDESFHPMPVDVVISADVIEHIPDTDKYLAMLKRFCARYYGTHDLCRCILFLLSHMLYVCIYTVRWNSGFNSRPRKTRAPITRGTPAEYCARS
jgi:SAM-dependent methyltransferase